MDDIGIFFLFFLRASENRNEKKDENQRLSFKLISLKLTRIFIKTHTERA